MKRKLTILMLVFIALSSLLFSLDKKAELQENVAYPSSSMNSRATILSEDFSGGALPAGWQNVDNGGFGEVWYFNNPGGRTINTSTAANGFAIFDSDYNGYAGGAEDCDLITPVMNCSGTANVHLEFQHFFYSGYGGAAEVFVSGDNGSSWTSVASWSATSTTNAQSESYDISAIAAGKSQVMVKFNWTGDYSWYWAVDDIRIYEQDPYDVTITKLTGDQSISIGESFNYLVQIDNKGANNDTYDLALSGGTWYSIYDKDDTGIISSIAINAGEVDTVIVKVNVPGTASHDDTDAVNLTATSQGSASVSAVTASPITTTAVDPTSVPYTEDFETNLDDWVIIQDAITSVNITTGAAHSGTYGCEIADVDPDDGYYGAGYLTQYFDPLTNPLLTFWYKFDQSSYYSGAYVQIYTATDGWTQWTFSGTTTDWTEVNLDLTGLDTESASWRVRFIVQPYSAVSGYIDDISIESVTVPPIASDPIPADAAINIDISPTLSWTNNYSVIDSSIVWFGDSTSDTFAPVDTLAGTASSYTYPGTLGYLTPYYWKVVNYNVAGDNSATAAQWSFTTVGSTPQIPINPSPADDATGVSVLPTLTWESTNADSFLVYYREAGGFGTGSFIVADTVTTNSFTFSSALNFNQEYLWKIEAGNSNGIVSSEEWSFTTIVPETFPFTEDFEGDVTGWTMDGTNSSWEIDEPTGLGTSGSPYFADPAEDHSDTGTKCAGTDLTTDGDYNSSETSYLTSPPIDCTGAATVVLDFWRWLNCENNYDEAYIEISSDAGETWTDLGHPTYVQEDAWTEVSMNITAQAAGETVQIRWKLASDGSFQKSGWNIDDISIDTLPAPIAATDPIPADNATDVSILPTLSWTNHGAIDSTLVYVDAALVDTLYGDANTYNPEAFAFSSTHTWKVVNYNVSGNTEASAVEWSFTTMSANPVNPIPADTETMCFEYIQFGWDDILGVDSYNIYIGTTAHGSDIVNGENITTNSYENTVALPLGDTYYWYVESIIDDDRAVMGTSADFSFVTAPIDYTLEGFEGSFPPIAWTNDSWNSSTTHHTQTKSAYRYGYSAQSDTLTSPRLDLSGGTGTEEMSFYWRSYSSYDTDSLLVVFNNGTTLDTLGVLKGVDYDWHKETYTLRSTSDDCYVEFRLFAPAYSGDSYYIDDVVLPPRWFPAISFTLAPATQSDAGEPGSDVVYTCSIENTGESSDTYDIAFGVTENWITSATPNPITVASGATETFTITVDIPADATEDVAHTDSLIVTSQELPSLSNVATVVTTPHTFDNQEPNDDFANATQINPTDSQSWESDPSSEIYPTDDLDFYVFSANAGDVVTLTQVVDGLSSLDGEIALYDASETLITNVDSGISGDDEQIVYTIPTTGNYYVINAHYSDLPLPAPTEKVDSRRSSEERLEKGKTESDSRASDGAYLFTFLVQSPAVISVTPTSISTTVEFDQTGSELLNVANTGDADLNYTSIATGTDPYVLNEGFETWFPADWTNSGWEDSRYGGPHTGSGYAYSNLEGNTMTTPSISIVAGHELRFWYRCESSSYPQDMDVLVNSTVEWSVTGLATTTYTEAVVDLSDYAGTTVTISFVGQTGSGGYDYGIDVDDVSVGTENSAPPTWLTLTDASGTVAGAANADITLNFDATGMDAGTYNANVVVASNGGDDVTVPITFTVNPFNAIPPDNMVITNNGDGTMTIAWDAVPSARSYYVYMAETPDAADWTTIQVDSNSYTYTVGETKMFFKVTSSDVAMPGDSMYSGRDKK